MTKLIFITHPSVVVDPLIPIDEWQVSKEGLMQVEDLFSSTVLLNINSIYSSTEDKALTVAKIIADKYFIMFNQEHQLKCLKEIKNRLFIPPDKFLQATKKWFDHPKDNVNDWESRNDAEQRIVNCVTNIMSKEENNTVVIVGHGGTGTLLKCHIKKVDPSQSEDQQSQGCYFVADWDKQELISDWIRF